jgi:Flp pilus assembly protein TadD
LDYFGQALLIRKRVVGPDHPDTARNLSNLAAVYQEKGNVEEAQKLLRESLKIWEMALGPDHPETAV